MGVACTGALAILLVVAFLYVGNRASTVDIQEDRGAEATVLADKANEKAEPVVIEDTDHRVRIERARALVDTVRDLAADAESAPRIQSSPGLGKIQRD